MKNLNQEIIDRIDYLETRLKLKDFKEYGYLDIRLRLDELKRLLV